MPQESANAWKTYEWSQPFDLERAPLDPPLGWGAPDWGGPGGNPRRPTRAQVLAALVVTDAPYPPPVEALRHRGEPSHSLFRPSYRHLTQAYVPDLVRMARDRALNTAAGDTDDVWAPVHAVYALSRLDIRAVVEDLMPLFDVIDDWRQPSLIQILASAGTAAVEPLRSYLTDPTRWVKGRWPVAQALAGLGQQWPEHRATVVAALTEALEAAETQPEELNAGIVGALVQVGAIESYATIRQAFALGAVEEEVYGDWQTVAQKLGVTLDPNDPLVVESAQRWEAKREAFFPSALWKRLEQTIDRLDRMESARKKSSPLSFPSLRRLLRRRRQ